MQSLFQSSIFRQSTTHLSWQSLFDVVYYNKKQILNSNLFLFFVLSYSASLQIPSASAISNTRYLELYLKLFFGPFSTLGNCCYNFVRYLAPRLVKLFSWSIQRFPRLFSIRYHERFHFTHSNVQRTTSKTLIEHLSLYFALIVIKLGLKLTEDGITINTENRKEF